MHKLRGYDGSWYNRYRNRMLQSGESKNGKRAQSQANYVLRFVHIARSLRLPVMSSAIQIEACSLHTKFVVEPDSFIASRGWLHKFLNGMEWQTRLGCTSKQGKFIMTRYEMK